MARGKVKTAMLSRLTAGLFKGAIIIALPGNKGAANDALKVLIPTIFHSFHMMRVSSIKWKIFCPFYSLLVSFIYSSVGMGGGSSYTAIMAYFGMNYNVIPINSLFLNLCVTFVGTLNFWRSGHGRLNLVAPFLITSIPMAFVAGFLNLPEIIFQAILILTFLIFITRIFIFDRLLFQYQLSKVQKRIIIICIGSLWVYLWICRYWRRHLSNSFNYNIWFGICKRSLSSGSYVYIVNSIASIVPEL